MTRDQSKSPSMTLYERVVEDERVQPRQLAGALGITVAELAASIGLSAETVSRHDDCPSIQHRLRDMVAILDEVTPWTGTDLQAYAWYRSEPLPSYGDRTAAELVGEGLSDAVRAHLCRISAGGYA